MLIIDKQNKWKICHYNQFQHKALNYLQRFILNFVDCVCCLNMLSNCLKIVLDQTSYRSAFYLQTRHGLSVFIKKQKHSVECKYHYVAINGTKSQNYSKMIFSNLKHLAGFDLQWRSKVSMSELTNAIKRLYGVSDLQDVIGLFWMMQRPFCRGRNEG